MVLRTLCLLALALGIAQAQWQYMSKEDSNSREHGQHTGSKTTSCACGWTNKARIVGGKETLVNEYPYAIAIINSRGMPFCGGTIISPNHCLTAAHCTQPFKGQQLRVVVGEHDLYSSYETNATKTIHVLQTIEHEQYHPTQYTHDIAILVLRDRIAFNQNVGPACMPTRRENLLNEHIKVLGWGRLWTNGQSARSLMKVNLRVVPTSACAGRYPYPIPVGSDEKQVCTFRRNKDSCQGDSGGPLIWLDPQTNRYTLVALVSYGKECGGRDPAVNTNVAAYMPWIESKVTSTMCKRIG